MEITPTGSSAPWRVLILGAIFVAGWTIVAGALGWRADVAESNLQANLIRITRYLNNPTPPVTLVGSSVAGRLFPEYFAADNLQVANLGLDGSRPLFVFEIMNQRKTVSPVVLVDTSALFQPLMANDETLRAATRAPTAAMSRTLPFFRPEFRPSSVVYEKIKTWREGGIGGVARNPLKTEKPPGPVEKPATYETVRDELKLLQDQGSRVVLLEIPRGDGWGVSNQGIAAELADELAAPYWEPGPAIFHRDGDVLRFSDGLHLNALGARRVAEWVAQKLHSSGD